MVFFNCPKAVILDIEGTISDIGFVSRTLFPFTKNNVKRYFEEMFDTPETQEMIKRLRESQVNDHPDMPKIASSNDYRHLIIRSVSEYALAHLLQRNRISEIKQLQILIWVWGYDKGLIKGHVYDEVTTVLHYWKNDFLINIYLFSSAMILAQKLLLCYTNHGNCLPLIKDYFDSSMGEKSNLKSFMNISTKINVNPSKILFISDNIKEVKAASDANFEVCLINRKEAADKNINRGCDKKKFTPVTISTLEDIKFN